MPKYIHRKNITYKNRIAKLNKKKIIGVAIDPAKYSHKVVIFDFTGKLIGPPFTINTLKDGYLLLKKKVERAKRKYQPKSIYFAVEAAGVHSENLYYHLRKDRERVYLVSPLLVAKNRTQKSFIRLKTDEIDAGAVGDLLIRGEFLSPNEEQVIYLKLRRLINWREKKIVFRSMLKNQIQERMGRIFPGINTNYGDNKKLFYHTFENFISKGLQRLGKTGGEFLKSSVDELHQEFGYSKFSSGKFRIKRLRKRLDQLLLPSERMARADIELLKRDVRLLDSFNDELRVVEDEIVMLGKKTPAKYIMNQIKGIDELLAATYVGLIGDVSNFKTAGHIFSKAGLSPSVKESGGAVLSRPRIKRFGNKLLRGVMFRMTQLVVLNEPVFNAYYKNHRREHKKHWKKSMIATCRKMNKVLFALMRDEKPFIRGPLEVRHES